MPISGGIHLPFRRFWRLAFSFGVACALLASLTPAADAATFSNPAPIILPQLGQADPYPSLITVSGMTGTTTNVTVRLTGLSHTFISDVNIVLVPPAGTPLELMANAGGSGTITNLDLTFSGASSLSVPSPLRASGTFKPTAVGAAGAYNFPAPGPGRLFCNPGPAAGGTPCEGADKLAEALNGFDPNGQWRLFAIDVFSGDSGMFAGGWALDITTGSGTPKTLTVNNPATGTGTLLGSGAVTGTKINCGGDCSSAYASGTSVALTATPEVGSFFGGFTGCTSTGPGTCSVTVDGAKAVTANFFPNPPKRLTVATEGPGLIAAAGIDCGTDCSEDYNGGVPIVLTATPSVIGARFLGWTGCELVSMASCKTTMTADKTITAAFTQEPAPPAPSPAPTPPAVAPPAVMAPPVIVSPVSPPATPDRTAPTVRLAGVRSSMSLRAFLRGVRVKVIRNEASSIDATLGAYARRATLAANANVALARRTLSRRAAGTTALTLRPSRLIVGRAKTLRARLVVRVTDASGNRTTAVKTIRIRR